MIEVARERDAFSCRSAGESEFPARVEMIEFGLVFTVRVESDPWYARVIDQFNFRPSIHLCIEIHADLLLVVKQTECRIPVGGRQRVGAYFTVRVDVVCAGYPVIIHGTTFEHDAGLPILINDGELAEGHLGGGFILKAEGNGAAQETNGEGRDPAKSTVTAGQRLELCFEVIESFIGGHG